VIDRAPRDLASLQARAAAGETFRYLCFWGHRPRADGAISSACFSQWFDAPFVVADVRYATAEHWMMAEKARLFGDAEAEAKILATADPAAAKAAGREVRGYRQALWEQHRFDIVVAGNRAKFEQSSDLGAYLIGTADRVLVEASPIDAIWGIGLAADDARVADPSRWRGLNLLGFALMRVRAALLAGC